LYRSFGLFRHFVGNQTNHINQINQIHETNDMKYRLLIAYDGTRYQGWQRQAQAPTVQGTIEGILQRVTQETVTLTGAGRTDAGVHAWGQVAHFQTRTDLSQERLLKALQALLPADIVIRSLFEAPPDFHARFGARRKTYDYCLWTRAWPVPFFRSYSWWIRSALDRSLMERGLAGLLGKKDFAAFQTSGSSVAQTVRTMFHAGLLPSPGGWLRLRFQADGFLRHMVRNIVGGIVRLGLGRMSLEEWRAIIESRDRSRAGVMAPPQGLFLRKVIY
jgi:tRNA pseudouridine38-40 synthase